MKKWLSDIAVIALTIARPVRIRVGIANSDPSASYGNYAERAKRDIACRMKLKANNLNPPKRLPCEKMSQRSENRPTTQGRGTFSKGSLLPLNLCPINPDPNAITAYDFFELRLWRKNQSACCRNQDQDDEPAARQVIT